MSHAHALDGHCDNLISATPRPAIDRRFVAALAGGLVLGGTVVLGTPPALEAYRSYQATVEAAAARVPAELPREWKWDPKAVKYEHMFRSER